MWAQSACSARRVVLLVKYCWQCCIGVGDTATIELSCRICVAQSSGVSGEPSSSLVTRY
jgi:hypothetical protein